MTSALHLAPARLEPDASLDDAEQAHLDECPRCRIEARLLGGFFTDAPADDDPAFQPVKTALDTVRSQLSRSLLQGTLAEVGRDAPSVVEVVPPGEPDRYETEGPLGSGGMGDVLRVRDRSLGRTVAMKVANPTFQATAEGLARFVEEAQVAAQLQHPGIVPVHEIGLLEDGRAYFTMKEVEGITLAEAIRDVHLAGGDGTWETGRLGWTFRRLVEAFRRTCDALAYAHSRGVCHRDLKPANVMLGPFGEVLVLDWGLAKVLGRADERGRVIETARTENSALKTQLGAVAGTPAWMPPEQAEGDHERIGPAADVYSLGAILYAILSGGPPYRGRTSINILRQVLTGPPAPPSSEAGPVPDELRDVCMTAMARAIDDRYANASELGKAVGDWLDGAYRRDRALAALEQARGLRPAASATLTRASDSRARARAALSGTRSFDGVEHKLEGWELEDEAARLEARAELEELEFTEAVRSALTHDPDLPAAHALLADHYRERHAEAERSGDVAAAERFERLLRAHDDGTHAGYLAGDGALTLHTDPPGLEVRAAAYVEEQRVLSPGDVRALGATPLDRVDLPMGSYAVTVGDGAVSLPLVVPRAGHADRIRPGDDRPHVLQVPDSLAPGDCLVPAGWFESGGDERTPSSLPGRRIWVDSFVIREHPVTHAEYLEFLNAVDVEHALEHAARERAAREGELGALLVEHRDDGTFALRTDAEGDDWEPHWPAWMVSWHGARAYAAWRAEVDGVPWRLPWELEWEKAARGVDGRPWPWGSFGDPTWACVHGHREGRPYPASVHAHPVDVSPFGVRGTAGNVCDWTLDVFTEEGPELTDGGLFERPAAPVPDDGQLSRCVKGGSWSNPIVHGRGAFRDGRHASDRRWVIGFRLARDA